MGWGSRFERARHFLAAGVGLVAGSDTIYERWLFLGVIVLDIHGGVRLLFSIVVVVAHYLGEFSRLRRWERAQRLGVF